MVQSAGQRSSLLPTVSFHNSSATLAEKLRRLPSALSTPRFRGLALFALGMLVLALSGHFSSLAQKYSGISVPQEPGAALTKAAAAILNHAAESAEAEAKAKGDEPSVRLVPPETEGINPAADVGDQELVKAREGSGTEAKAATANSSDAVAGGEDVARATTDAESGLTKGDATSAQAKLGDGTETGGDSDAGCRHSSQDSNGLICVDDEMWHRILQSEEAAWLRINSSLREAPDALGRPVRARYDAPHADYPENVDARTHHWMRRDYLQAVWVPTMSCPEEVRVGETGDGGKWLCGLHRVGRRALRPGTGEGDDRCLIYSFGSNNLFGFENGMLEGTGGAAGGGCEIEVFDHTARPSWSPPASPRLRLHKLGIRAAVAPSEKRTDDLLDSFEGLRKRLGHGRRRVDVLKMDVEGAEWAVLPEIVRSADPPGQLLLETHLQGAPTLGTREADALLLTLRDAGYVMTHTEVNYNGALNFNEYSFIHLKSRTTQ